MTEKTGKRQPVMNLGNRETVNGERGKRTLRLSVLAPRAFVLAIQFATFGSGAWRAARVQNPRALMSFIFLCLKEILTNSLTTG